MRTIVLAAALLSGCGLNPQYRAERDAERLVQFEEECVKIGYAKGTPAMTDCKLARLTAYEQSLRGR